MDLFRSHFIWLVCTAHFALCMSSNLCCCLLFYIYGPLSQICSNPLGCVSHSFHHSLCLVDKMLDAYFSVMIIMMTTMMEKHLAMPFLHFFTFLPYPLLQLNCSRAPGSRSQMSLLSLSNIWHWWLFSPSSQICFPWLLWLRLPDVPPIPPDF